MASPLSSLRLGTAVSRSTGNGRTQVLSRLEKALVGASVAVGVGGLLLRVIGVRRASAAPRPDAPGPDLSPPIVSPTPPAVLPGESATTLSQAGLQFIADHEGFRSALYNDAAGYCTIGYGHLVHMSACDGTESSTFKQGLTKSNALALLQADAAEATSAINSLVTVPLSQTQFDALASFVFNTGVGNFRSSTLLKRLNSSDYGGVPYEMERWVYAGGKKLQGLVNRRADEARLFQSGTY